MHFRDYNDQQDTLLVLLSCVLRHLQFYPPLLCTIRVNVNTMVSRQTMRFKKSYSILLNISVPLVFVAKVSHKRRSSLMIFLVTDARGIQQHVQSPICKAKVQIFRRDINSVFKYTQLDESLSYYVSFSNQCNQIIHL